MTKSPKISNGVNYKLLILLIFSGVIFSIISAFLLLQPKIEQLEIKESGAKESEKVKTNEEIVKVITDFTDPDVSGTVTQYPGSETAAVSIIQRMEDVEESKGATWLSCDYYAYIFYNASSTLEGLSNQIQKLIDERKMEGPNAFEIALNFPLEKYTAGYKLTEFKMSFVDKEDGSKIADCNMIGGLHPEGDYRYNWYETTSKEELEKQREFYK